MSHATLSSELSSRQPVSGDTRHKSSQANGQANSGQTGIESSFWSQLPTWLFTAVVIWLLWRGWSLRDQHYLTAESGIGYWLGIIGGSLMLALLLYPARKHVRWMRNWGPIRYWFRTHMIFGVLGPLLVLFHSNFSLGSTNSRVALFCMLLVAGSGLVGRYLYSRIHFGLYGKRASLVELTDLIRHNRQQLDWIAGLDQAFRQRLERLENHILVASDTCAGQFEGHLTPWQWLALRWFSWCEYRQLRRLLRQFFRDTGHDSSAVKRQRKQARQFLTSHQNATARVLEFRFYERLFSLWHVVHLPFFIMLVVSGVVHVIAVHLY